MRFPILAFSGMLFTLYCGISPPPANAQRASGLPDPHLTPGALNPAVTQANIQQTICVRGYTKTIRPPERYTETLKHRQLREYGYADQHIWHYEEDHLVPLEVGGAPRDPRNLWPEPHYGKWGSFVKDQLENELHWRVCHGRMSLRAARRIFETNWIAGWKRYVRPRLHHNGSSESGVTTWLRFR